ncbi:P-loop containing nucleoside triphosphate hydrolase protein [Decorospora gaudefroyi]|uniref:P-loop containing nucleoside triphosphate hydrolase protein n=1 Tax=Decorospora gaudefroyi TaxID=184978 RepID=A0A6A5K395_9PLEO|nr:P-loop containing nucleoside triphosphate hydrolase protein [Decorospora gaudefroyi]
MSSKRPRALTSGIDSSGGVGRNSRNKRPRRSEARSSDESSSKRSYAGSSSDASDDEGGEESRDEKEAWATQQVQKERQANKQNVATDSGIIEEIHCVNFMCHEHLTVTLGPLINFIVGQNGSGKSAVLTALTICLGGKATATNRAQSLKSLIKEGKDHASVTVKIKNQGPLAFKPAQYGDSIIVERHFNRSGTSGFKLKDRNNKLVTNKKAELEDILDAFSMQIDNPMNVLTQDLARAFLNSSSPKEKYRFFLLGTQLENLNRDYQQIEQSLDQMQHRTEVKESDLGDLRKKMQDLAKKAQRAQKLELMRIKETVVANQVAWAHVQECEEELRQVDSELETVDAVIEKRKTAVEEASERYERADQAHDAAKQEITDITAEMEPAKQCKVEAKAKFDEVKSKLQQLQTEERQARGELEAKQKEMNRIEADIVQRRKRQAEADDGVYAEKVRELDEARIACEAAQKAFANHGEELRPLRAQLNEAHEAHEAAVNKVERARQDEEGIKRNIGVLQKGQRNWIDSFPNSRKLQELLNAIESGNRFREKPVGPLGRHVKLVRPEWGYILEKQFGQSLNAFVVTSKQDQTALGQLMDRIGWHAPVYIGNSNYIDTKPNEPHDPSLLTWLKALKIENNLVRNQFIIHQSVEQVVLIEDMNEGARFMHARGPSTRNVKMCFTFADDDQRKGRVINYTSSGGVNNSPIGQFTGILRMQVDKEDLIKEEQKRLQAMRRELHDLNQACSIRKNHMNTCKDREQNHLSKKRRLQLESQGASEKVDRLEGELSEATPDAAAIEVLEDALDTAKAELQRHSDIYTDIKAKKIELNEENRANKREMDTAEEAVRALERRLEEAQSAVRSFQGTREDELKQKNEAITKVAKAEDNRVQWMEERKRKEEATETAMAMARGVCSERVLVPAGRTAEELSNILTRLVATRKSAEQQLGGSQDELLRQANDAKRTHQEAMQEFEHIKSLRNQLMNTLNSRKTRWKQFRSGISTRARVTFNYLLSERKFRGTLMIDHKKSLLDIHVQPDIMERSGDGRQTKTLSGGEKSYSTVCLLLSLWDAMGSPIRCLDEFDVFMDSVNRERSMIMIIEAARRSIGRQFIFITPQSMSKVTQTSDVKIIRMTDPERGQTALNVQQT